jgi:hypothetical protein
VDKHDYEATQAIFIRRWPQLAWIVPFKQYITPAVLCSVIAAMAIAIWYVVGAVHELHGSQADIRRHDESIATLQKQNDILNEIKTQIAVVNSKVDNISSEVDRQREWREHVETEAESRPHLRHK